MKTGKMKDNVKKNMIVALTVAPALAVMLISAVYNISAGSIEGQITAPEPMLLAVLTVFAVAGSVTLAVVYDIKPTLAVFALVFLACFIFYLFFFINGDSTLVSEKIFENATFVLAFPAWSVMPLISAVSSRHGVLAVLITVFVLFLINTGFLAYLCVGDRRAKK